MLTFILYIEALEGLVILWNFLDVHALSNGLPKIKQAETFPLAHDSPAITLIPPNGFEEKRGKNVQEVFVGNRESSGQLVYALNGTLASLAGVSPFHQFADQDVRLVIPFLRPLAKLAGSIQQTRNTRYTEGAE